MKAIHRRRLLKLADFLEQLSPKVFDMNIVTNINHFAIEPSSGDEWLKTMKKAAKEAHSCGATACAIGYLPVVFPRSFFYDTIGCSKLLEDHSANFDAADKFFDLSRDESFYLFEPGEYPVGKRNRTAKCVARRIRKFVAKKQKEAQKCLA